MDTHNTDSRLEAVIQINELLASWHRTSNHQQQLQKIRDYLATTPPTGNERSIQMLPNGIDLRLLHDLLIYSDRYEISIQFWPEQTAVFIAKDGVDLSDYGGSKMFAVKKAIEYLDRITGNNKTKIS